MKNYIYALFNNLSKRFGDVMCYPSDAYALNALQKKMPNGQPIIDTKEFDLCRLGTIDIETGVVETTAPVHLVWNVPDPLPTVEVK